MEELRHYYNARLGYIFYGSTLLELVSVKAAMHLNQQEPLVVEHSTTII